MLTGTRASRLPEKVLGEGLDLIRGTNCHGVPL